jgi:hypothetical protein
MLRRDIDRVPTPTCLVSISVRRMNASDGNIPGGSDVCSAPMIAFHEASITETRVIFWNSGRGRRYRELIRARNMGAGFLGKNEEFEERRHGWISTVLRYDW